MNYKEFNYRVENGYCFFTKGPLSQWYGAYKHQEGGFTSPESGDWFNCAEQWMMANKAIFFGDMPTAHLVMNETDPRKQKELGRTVKNFEKKAWDKVKYNIVLMGNFLKFQQNVDLLDFLTSFQSDTYFVEAAPWDKVWGIGMGMNEEGVLNTNNWKGQNLLGQVISQVRKSRVIKTQSCYRKLMNF